MYIISGWWAVISRIHHVSDVGRMWDELITFLCYTLRLMINKNTLLYTQTQSPVVITTEINQ